MPEQSTEPATIGSQTVATIGGQRPAISALAALAEMFDHLPPGYITLADHSPAQITMQVPGLPEFEQWRSALQIPVPYVELHAYGANSWLSLEAVVHGLVLQVTCTVFLLPEAAQMTPAEDEQRTTGADDRQAAESASESAAAVMPLANAIGSAA